MSFIIIFIICAALFFAVMLNLTFKGTFRKRIMGFGCVIAIVLGLFSYSYGYAMAFGVSASVAIRVLLSTCRMFGGVNDFSTVAGTPLFQHEAMRTLFWLGHFLAFYITASAAIEVLGHRLIRRIRARMARRGNLCVIYGDTDEALELARQQKEDQSVVLVVEQENEAISAHVEAMGCALFSGGVTLCGTPEFLKSIAYEGGKRALNLYCMSEDSSQNLRYAEAMCRALEARGVDPGRTRLFLLGIPERKAARLVAQPDRYGYGSVFACEKYELIARLMIRKAPPWTFIGYDGMARATSDFRVFIVGFGRMGRAAFEQVVMNGQMEGSTFHTEIFDSNPAAAKSYLEACCPGVPEAFDISVNSSDPEVFYRKLAEHTPCMILLCGGTRKANADLAVELERYYANRSRKPALIQCVSDSLIVDDREYRLGSIDLREVDRLAMILNHVYCGGESEEADWRNCPPFNRSSSRASADFYPAYLHATGISREAAIGGQWPPDAEILENLARTEHLRWCAFMLAAGYRPMSEDEFAERAARCKDGEKLRIARNDAQMTHACLIPWAALEALSERENAITGEPVDYKAMDRNNVLAITRLIQSDRG